MLNEWFFILFLSDSTSVATKRSSLGSPKGSPPACPSQVSPRRGSPKVSGEGAAPTPGISSMVSVLHLEVAEHGRQCLPPQSHLRRKMTSLGLNNSSLVSESLFSPSLHYKACSVAQSRSTLCDPCTASRHGSSVHGISQARVLEWVAISFSWQTWPNSGVMVRRDGNKQRDGTSKREQEIEPQKEAINQRLGQRGM